LPGEATSIVRSEDVMTTLDLAVSSFGQSLKITPIEMITAYAAVVNGGKLVTPYVVNRIVDSNGNVVKQFEPVIKRQVISEETSKTMRETLESVVVTNGGSNAYIQGYRIGGKSGTSQKIDEYGRVEGSSIYVSSYVGFAPADDPEIIMLVMVDEPMGGKYFGSLVAAPVVSAVFEEALPYLGYFKEYTEEEYQKLNVVVPDVVGKDITSVQETLKGLNLNPKVVGNGGTVIKQIPAAGATMPKNGNIYLYTEDNYDEQLVTVPDVTNMSLQDANKAITNAGLNFMATGGAANSPGAFAVSQSVVGQKVPKGSVIEVKFVVNNETG
jgi:stage V sporulation protein D (sporulation-specific penicillin-binding protein)